VRVTGEIPKKLLTFARVDGHEICDGQSVLARSLPRRWLDGVLIAAVAIAGLYGAARIGLKPRDPAAGIGVIFAPWVSEATALQRATAAGARVVRYGDVPFVVVVVPDAPDYVGRMLAAGALLVVDPRTLAACLSFLSERAER
jgi:hypothetical protein